MGRAKPSLASKSRGLRSHKPAIKRSSLKSSIGFLKGSRMTRLCIGPSSRIAFGMEWARSCTAVLEYRLRSLTTTTDSVTNYPERNEALPSASLQRQDQHGQGQLQVGTSGLRLYVDDNLFTHSLSESVNSHLSWPVVTLPVNAFENSQYLQSILVQ
ncbi:Uncharacterized protein Fot_07101 [Forsythia ovata]|uniref:Ribosomal protein L2 n=1 Tax=Forsythia ovata TaxID=205694 RepID=A0ABD1WUU5_9LAMI